MNQEKEDSKNLCWISCIQPTLFSNALSFVFSLFFGCFESVTGNRTVKILEVCKVAPLPSPPGPASFLPLTFFDVFWLRFPPNKRLFFYEAPYTTAFFTSTIIPKLKHSLSLTLKHYLPVTGDLTWPQNSLEPFIDNIAGGAVSFTVAESQADFYHLTGNSYLRAQEHDSLLPVLLATNTKVPVMALQVTVFPDVGYCIGYAILHVVMDGKTTSMFMHTWAYICRQGGDPTPKPTLTYDRSSIKSHVEIEKAYLQAWMNQGGPNNKAIKPWETKTSADTMYGTFVLTKTNIERIKKWVCRRYQEIYKQEIEFHLSSYTIASAFVWVCLAKTQKPKIEKTSLVISADCRALWDPPLPSTYFGNCVFFRMAEAKTEDLMGKDSMVIAAQAIGKAIMSLRDGVLDGAEEWIYKLFSMKTEGLYSVAGASSFEHYKTDFGWGRPKKVNLASIREGGGAFSISDCIDGDGGVEIGVALTQLEIEIFGSLFASAFESL